MRRPASGEGEGRDVQSHARVVIVGGGIMGASLAYHLAREGWGDCLLIEKAELTSGSTWHAAGQVSHSVSHFGLAKMNGYAVDLYPRLEAETGQSVTWHGCGSLRLAYTEDEVDWLRYTLSVGRGLGFNMAVIGPGEIARLHPFYNLDGVLAALHTPDDGHVDPAGATFALAKGARQMGAKVVRHNRVTGIRRLESGEWEVESEAGCVRAEHVVNAGGTYARQIGQWVGLDLPIVNMTHHYLVTDTVPEFLELARELPVVRDDRLVSGYIRMEQKSGLIGIYEKANPNTVWDEGTPWEAEHELFEADLERIEPWLVNAFGRMPVLAELGIKRTVHGAITHPPDGNMLLGPAPGLRNFWCCCGSQVGIAWGPGAGKYLAQWMVHGTAEINMRDFESPTRASTAPRAGRSRPARSTIASGKPAPSTRRSSAGSGRAGSPATAWPARTCTASAGRPGSRRWARNAGRCASVSASWTSRPSPSWTSPARTPPPSSTAWSPTGCRASSAASC
jgi:dimethylglycine dehydrogenase